MIIFICGSIGSRYIFNYGYCVCLVFMYYSNKGIYIMWMCVFVFFVYFHLGSNLVTCTNMNICLFIIKQLLLSSLLSVSGITVSSYPFHVGNVSCRCQLSRIDLLTTNNIYVVCARKGLERGKKAKAWR